MLFIIQVENLVMVLYLKNKTRINQQMVTIYNSNCGFVLNSKFSTFKKLNV